MVKLTAVEPVVKLRDWLAYPEVPDALSVKFGPGDDPPLQRTKMDALPLTPEVLILPRIVYDLADLQYIVTESETVLPLATAFNALPPDATLPELVSIDIPLESVHHEG